MFSKCKYSNQELNNYIIVSQQYQKCTLSYLTTEREVAQQRFNAKAYTYMILLTCFRSTLLIFFATNYCNYFCNENNHEIVIHDTASYT